VIRDGSDVSVGSKNVAKGVPRKVLNVVMLGLRQHRMWLLSSNWAAWWRSCRRWGAGSAKLGSRLALNPSRIVSLFEVEEGEGC